jgi:hypothetical protein
VLPLPSIKGHLSSLKRSAPSPGTSQTSSLRPFPSRWRRCSTPELPVHSGAPPFPTPFRDAADWRWPRRPSSAALHPRRRSPSPPVSSPSAASSQYSRSFVLVRLGKKTPQDTDSILTGGPLRSGPLYYYFPRVSATVSWAGPSSFPGPCLFRSVCPARIKKRGLFDFQFLKNSFRCLLRFNFSGVLPTQI